MTNERMNIIKAAGCAYCMELIDWTEKLEAKETPIEKLENENLLMRDLLQQACAKLGWQEHTKYDVQSVELLRARINAVLEPG